jgi:peptide/nickel transport system permease protein
MLRYVIQRLALLLATAFGVVTITFVMSRMRPGSPAELMLGSRPTAEQIAAAKEALGLNDPLIVQYATYMGNVFRGDLGQSLVTGQPVLNDIAARFPATLEIVIPALSLSVLIGILLGVLAAVREGQVADHAVRFLAVAGVAMPIFFLAVALQLVFHGSFTLLPLNGRIATDVRLDAPFATVTGFFLIDTVLARQWGALLSTLQHMVLPVLTLTIAMVAIVLRVTRNLMVEVLRTDHVRTAFAYGLPKRQIYFRYALRATLIPLLTVIGLTFGYILGGSIIVEYVFDWPGLGGYVVNAVIVNDINAALGVTILLSLSYLLINLAVDIAYHMLDPRLKMP